MKAYLSNQLQDPETAERIVGNNTFSADEAPWSGHVCMIDTHHIRRFVPTFAETFDATFDAICYHSSKLSQCSVAKGS